MRKPELYIAALVVTATILFSCTLPAAGNNAGSQSSGPAGGQTRAVAAATEQFAKLDLSGTAGETNYVFVYEGIVYMLGRYFNGSRYVSCCWIKSSQGTSRMDLPVEIGRTESYVPKAIFVYRGTVYTAGSYQSGIQDIAAYWVNGDNKTDLCFGKAYAKSIYVAHGIK